jgi:high-affinity nickel-transport protein
VSAAQTSVSNSESGIAITHLHKDHSRPLWMDITKCGSVVLCLAVGGVLLLLSGVFKYPMLLGMAVLSLSFGLRHAFDCDHIAAIDNMTRKLIQEGRPNIRSVGFFFSVGHSLVVILMAVATIFFVKWATKALPAFNAFGGGIATLIAGIFLIILALMNLLIIKDIIATFKTMQNGTYCEATDEANKGTVSRWIKAMFAIVEKDWHIILVGFLFGLGFDTATQIAVLATSAAAAAKGIPTWTIMSFPILFTAGMCTMDSLDGFFMSSAYRWAFSSPLRKVYFNLTITVLSILAAGVIGIIEVFQVFSQELGWTANFWVWLQNLDFNIMGFMLVGMFIVVWALAIIIWKVARLDQKDQELINSLAAGN